MPDTSYDNQIVDMKNNGKTFIVAIIILLSAIFLSSCEKEVVPVSKHKNAVPAYLSGSLRI